MELSVTADMLVEGRHFLPAADPRLLGHKALAVNLSDLAASGAAPRGFFLSIALPAAGSAGCSPSPKGSSPWRPGTRSSWPGGIRRAARKSSSPSRRSAKWPPAAP
jgi:hypothetical protein